MKLGRFRSGLEILQQGVPSRLPFNTRKARRMSWRNDELNRIVASDDLHISPFRDDKVTYGTLMWIWLVVVDGNLYVLAYNGRSSRWYKSAMRQRAGRIQMAGMTKDVNFEPVDGAISDAIDAAYRSKYASSHYLAPMISDRARSATVRIQPLG